MTALLLLVNALVAILMVILILLQRSDSGSGGMFGGAGGTQAVVRNPLARPTAILAAIFLVNCVVIAYFTKGHEQASSIMHQAAPTSTGQEVSPTSLPLDLPQALPAVSPALEVSPAAH